MKDPRVEVCKKYQNETQFTMNRKNDGFTVFELVGFIEVIKEELISQANAKREKPETYRNAVYKGEDYQINFNKK